MSADRTCVVIGAGPAGLASAAMLRKAGLDTLIVEQAPHIVPQWRARYDGFRLNTSRWFSYLPGRRLPRAAGRWPSREALVTYYEDYARRKKLEVQLGTTVTSVERAADDWQVETSAGPLVARNVVVATGKYRTPVIPPWSGKDQFQGNLCHADAYRNPEPYRDKRVLVIGPGASGCEIATQLAHGGAARVWLAVRTPPHIIHRDVGPVPSDLFAVLGRRLPVAVVDRLGEWVRRLTIGDLSAHGLDPPPDGIYTRVRETGMIPTVDGPYVEAVKRRDVLVVPAVERFEPRAVRLIDGTSLAADAAIAATGYRRDLEPLVGHLGVLREDGQPVAHGKETHPDAPGLYFTGFTEPFSGNLRELRLDARKIAVAIASRELR